MFLKASHFQKFLFSIQSETFLHILYLPLDSNNIFPNAFNHKLYFAILKFSPPELIGEIFAVDLVAPDNMLIVCRIQFIVMTRMRTYFLLLDSTINLWNLPISHFVSCLVKSRMCHIDLPFLQTILLAHFIGKNLFYCSFAKTYATSGKRAATNEFCELNVRTKLLKIQKRAGCLYNFLPWGWKFAQFYQTKDQWLLSFVSIGIQDLAIVIKNICWLSLTPPRLKVGAT